MSQRLADRLIAARRRRFVGRTEELARFKAALAADEPPFQLLYVYGPGGVGKTTLLAEYARLAQAAGLAVAQLDGRSLEPVPPAFTAALCAALDVPPDVSVPDALAAQPGRSLIVIDGYEHLAPLAGLLRTFGLLPELQ